MKLTLNNLGIGVFFALLSCSHTAGARPTDPSTDFFATWADGKAEVSTYEVSTSHYGETRMAMVTLVFVTEPMDQRNWIKDDAGETPREHRRTVMKLNNIRKFRTGIYDYSVMTSVFSPIDGRSDDRRFSPKRITFSSQEWCGHVFYKLMPKEGKYLKELRSYFSVVGEQSDSVAVPPGTLYEDALFIQLRELDGPFGQEGDWTGNVVPTLWSTHKAHQWEGSVPSVISRKMIQRNGGSVNRFNVRVGNSSRTVDIEASGDHRILGWDIEGVESAKLIKSERLAYWNMNGVGNESHWERLSGGAHLSLRAASSGLSKATAISHDLFDGALKKHVKGGLVDYKGFKADQQLAQYIKMLAVANPKELGGDDEKLAFWINAYNAFTIQGVAALWPKISSVSNVYPNFGFFKRKQYVIGSRKYSLDQIENKIIRKQFDEPRIHAALNCASFSCPLLANYAFSGERLDAQLEERMRLFVNDSQRNKIDLEKGVLRISEIFKWFKEDFDKHGGIRAFVGRYLSAEDRQRLGQVKVRYLKYDWSLNKV